MEITKGLYGEMADSEHTTTKNKPGKSSCVQKQKKEKERKSLAQDRNISKEQWPWL